jgi:very-short-patch-repair endonuclease
MTSVGTGVNQRDYPPIPPELVLFARDLRSRQTDAERFMWYLLRGRRLAGLKFRRQHPIAPYVLDFYCHEVCLAVALDGGRHNTPDARRYDQARSQSLQNRGICVLRFWNFEIFDNTDGVIEAIWRAAMIAK